LKLLGELLLDRHNFTVMTRYISNPDNLKLMMNMLKEKSRNIQFEAFHVFKVSWPLNIPTTTFKSAEYRIAGCIAILKILELSWIFFQAWKSLGIILE